MPKVTIATGGAFCMLTGGGGGQVGGGPRGEVRGFSFQSRKRLIDLLHQVDRAAVDVPLFVTLTYPAEWPADWKEYKRHLKAWVLRLRRAYPDASVIWRLEYQKRGAPHYHVLVFGIPFLPIEWVSSSWFEVVGSGDVRHLAAGTQVARVLTWRGASYYCAKYLGKVQSGDGIPTGRIWGKSGPLPVDLVELELSWDSWHRVRRVLGRWYKRKTGRPAWWVSQRRAGITAYLPEADAARLLAWAVAG